MLCDTRVDALAPAARMLGRLPVRWLVACGACLAGGLLLHRAHLVGDAALASAGIVFGHGALFAAALAGAGPQGERLTMAVVATLVVGATLVRVTPLGALAYLAIPAMLVRAAPVSASLRSLGVQRPQSVRWLVVGVASGLALGLHLVVSAERTFGYTLTLRSYAAYVAGIAYDAGVNVPSAELLFRGVLFNTIQQRFTLTHGLFVSTVCVVLRYLLDPSLPKVPEIAAGAIFYVAALSVLCCLLFRASGSLLPGALASLTLFAFYRALGL